MSDVKAGKLDRRIVLERFTETRDAEDDMHVRFTADYDYTPSGARNVTMAYPSGWEGTVKRECGEAAILAGSAVSLDGTPPPPEKPIRARRG